MPAAIESFILSHLDKISKCTLLKLLWCGSFFGSFVSSFLNCCLLLEANSGSFPSLSAMRVCLSKVWKNINGILTSCGVLQQSLGILSSSLSSFRISDVLKYSTFFIFILCHASKWTRNFSSSNSNCVCWEPSETSSGVLEIGVTACMIPVKNIQDSSKNVFIWNGVCLRVTGRWDDSMVQASVVG